MVLCLNRFIDPPKKSMAFGFDDHPSIKERDKCRSCIPDSKNFGCPIHNPIVIIFPGEVICEAQTSQ